MKRLPIALLLAVCLSACASAPRPQLHVVPPKAPIVKAVPKATPAVTPNQIVKKRWYDRFPKHPKFFH